MPDLLGPFRVQEDGSLAIERPVSLQELLRALGVQIDLFLARMESCERTAEGNYRLTSATTGTSRGARILWENVNLLAMTSLACEIPPLTGAEQEELEHKGVYFGSSPVELPRTFVPLSDALRQLTFLILWNETEEWTGTIPLTTIIRLRALRGELRLHEQELDAEARSRGGYSADAVASSDNIRSSSPCEGVARDAARDAREGSPPTTPAGSDQRSDETSSVAVRADPATQQDQLIPIRGGRSEVAHGEDFTWLVAGGQRYRFSKGQQAEVIRHLYAEWERSGRKDGCGLSEATLGDKVGSSTSRFRVQKVFDGNAAKGQILRTAGKGVWALYLQDVT